ncbi:bacitracin ABC transporter ATP-binding protein [Cytobacillus firmus]|uniref:ATP-binding cassette domain-containing protein n=1 Tax=Cytobacillus firmus TaxID=1399 RepID=UPI00077C34CD|nr:ATP-binding cassette domain-containing protein [Cytobacillus firmus]MBG9544946.1 bacitracin ABC transporter ATP-binding protein [Cytobacillus firmus]MBG9554251.1 bacitracin ABC transporter ATP-binding protein [Cytobacillus firmus]MBG9557082.1 bacitracin ABC transporter ATP-binding protein [Cytobacillus firmus]MBG9576588.1 bacitracin ABC transporter ATP-binding protein [Cytobacillus firmus]MBG9655810.1 bacitracin ABC transporter ATP-binding protein [Cytobacillus firmus]
MDVLRTFGLTKIYQNKQVVQNIDMTIKKGEIYGLIGKNGAGKTTTLKMILHLIKPTKGKVELFGKNPAKNQSIFEKIGSFIGHSNFYHNLTAEENLEIHRRLMGVTSKKRTEEMLRKLNLMQYKDKKVEDFSVGMKQRLGIARSMLHYPEFLILDEPTNGLDPQVMKDLRQTLLKLANDYEVAILLSSHILSEIDHLFSVLGIIHRGRLIEELNYEALQEKKKRYLQISVNNVNKASFILENEMKISDYVICNNGLIKIYNSVQAAELNARMVDGFVEVYEMVNARDSLENYFLSITKEEDLS